MLTLYINPGSCSLASHIALEESGLAYRTERVALAEGRNLEPGYLARNPWGRVPALDLGGEVLTENVAILSHVADLAPGRRLLPPNGTLERARAIEFMATLSSTVHVAFRPIFRPERLASGEEGRRDVTDTGLAALASTLAKLDASLEGRRHSVGDAFTLCDAYLLVFALWTRRPALAGRLPRFARIDAIAGSTAERPAARTALAAEGLAPPD